jgi:phospholipid/cholesterol/gamma-HCH transport system substrate-binding protein
VERFKSGDVPEDLERTVKNVSEATEKLKDMIAGFQPSLGGGDGIAGDLRATLGGAREAMASLAENLEALKHGFFFRGFFKDRGFYDLGSLSPAEYQSKDFEKNVKKERTWVEQDQLFTVDSGGSETLTDSGKEKLNTMMAGFLRFINDRAVIVEGYAAAGTVAEQFLQSQDRATQVRDYLIGKFTLNPEYIGIMPLGSGGEARDGIALVLLKE